jgi:diguanylate cyclase
MFELLIEFAAILVTGVIGVTAGFWVRNGKVRFCEQEQLDRKEDESRRSREAVTRLQDLARQVATEVGEHNTRVREINDELTTGDPADAECVFKAMRELIDVNKQMQQQLETAEDRSHKQAVEFESRMEEALTDSLTKLKNRRFFDEELGRRQSELQRHNRPVSVMFLDVDHFKKFNDTHGHQAGDEVLRGVGRVLTRTVREMDVPCRYGGEEFAIILPGTTVSDGVRVADRARRDIEREVFRFEGAELQVAVSAGVAELMLGESVETAVQRADEGLYASKEAGRNCCHWHDGTICRLFQGEAGLAPSSLKNESDAATKPKVESPVPSEDLPDGVAGVTSFRECVRQRLAEQKRGGASFSVMFVDIDEFPRIVARFGEEGGKLAFRALGGFLKAAMREMDVVARLSDQEYALLLPSASLRDATRVSHRLQQAMARFSVPLPEGKLQFTASVGIAESQITDDVKHILARAERALESAETNGTNLVRAFTETGVEEVTGHLVTAES